MITRIITPLIEKTNKSILLQGPRQVGKSTLINNLKLDLALFPGKEVSKKLGFKGLKGWKYA